MINLALSEEEINEIIEESGIVLTDNINIDKIRNAIAKAIDKNNKIILEKMDKALTNARSRQRMGK